MTNATNQLFKRDRPSPGPVPRVLSTPHLSAPQAIPPCAKLTARVTQRLSFISDLMFGPIAAQAARKYSRAIKTPDHFVEMLFLVEDKRFPIHCGVDPLAMLRALMFNLRGGPTQGASTITQQVYTIHASQTMEFRRSVAYKFRQVVWAATHAAVQDKADILREYIDTVYWGRSYHGLDMAVAGYFSGTQRRVMSVAQSFFLAERIGAPNRICPQRIANLLGRPTIRVALARNRATIRQVIELYRHVYGLGEDLCQMLAKSIKR